MDNTKALISYLDQLVLDYTQLCQRDNGSVYGIASGKQCRKGKPISFNPNQPRSKTSSSNKGSKERASNTQKVSTIVSKAKSLGVSNKEISRAKEEVKTELNAKRVQGKEAVKLFAKKINDIVKSKGESSGKNNNNNDGAEKTNTPSKILEDMAKDSRQRMYTNDPEQIKVLDQLVKQGLVVQLWGRNPNDPNSQALYALKNELNKYREKNL